MKEYVQNGIDCFDVFKDCEYQHYVTSIEMFAQQWILNEYNIPFSIVRKDYTDKGSLIKVYEKEIFNQ